MHGSIIKDVVCALDSLSASIGFPIVVSTGSGTSYRCVPLRFPVFPATRVPKGLLSTTFSELVVIIDVYVLSAVWRMRLGLRVT
jgi:hypothetical protein